MDTITSFVLLVSGVAFLAAWMARSPHFSYIGLQMAFSYFLIAFEDYSAPTSMLPARDRILGIALALFVMWVVFLEIAPRKTVTEMRLALARVLAEQAELLRLNEREPKQDMHQGAKLRELIVHQLVTLRGMSEMVPYEITTRRQSEQQQSDRILEASLAAGNLFLTAETRMYDLQEGRKEFSQQNLAIAKELETWASRLRGEQLSPHQASSILPPAKSKLQNSYLRLEKTLLAIGN
jgi:multidrug resistance protein MdtO